MKRVFLGACLGAALAAPTGAQAATVRLQDDFDERSNTTTQEVIYSAAAGEANRLTASFDGTRFYALSDPAGITPGRGCTRPNPADPTNARCEITADGGTSGITVNAGDRDDTVTISGAGAVLRGGDGNDVLTGADFGNRFEGGNGDDDMSGGGSVDLFAEGSSKNGADRMSGNDGIDEVSYLGRRHRVHADLQGDRDDGEAGERDLVNDNVEDLTGGRAGDRLTGGIADNTIVGAGGSDLIKGAGGDDELAAGLGPGGRTRRHTHDRIEGGSGRDSIVGSAGPNRLRGGPDFDFIDAAGGNDRISDRDGKIDRIECGRGRDRARLDGFDFIADRCERVRRTFIPAGIPLELSSTGRRGGTAFIDVGCPRDAPLVCHGRTLLKLGRRTLGSRKFRVRHGHTKDVAIELPSDTVARLRPGGTKLHVIVRSLDARGRTRVIRADLELPAF